MPAAASNGKRWMSRREMRSDRPNAIRNMRQAPALHVSPPDQVRDQRKQRLHRLEHQLARRSLWCRHAGGDVDLCSDDQQFVVGGRRAPTSNWDMGLVLASMSSRLFSVPDMTEDGARCRCHRVTIAARLSSATRAFGSSGAVGEGEVKFPFPFLGLIPLGQTFPDEIV